MYTRFDAAYNDNSRFSEAPEYNDCPFVVNGKSGSTWSFTPQINQSKKFINIQNNRRQQLLQQQHLNRFELHQHSAPMTFEDIAKVKFEAFYNTFDTPPNKRHHHQSRHHHQHSHNHHHHHHHNQHNYHHRQHEEEQKQQHYYNGNTKAESINYNKRVSSPHQYRNIGVSGNVGGGGGYSNINNNESFKLYGSTCDFDSYHTLPIQPERLQQNEINCQNSAYEQHYQHYYSYFYKTGANTVQQKPSKLKQQRKSRKLPSSPSAMPFIKEPVNHYTPNENDLLTRISRIGTQQNHRHYTQNNVLREKTTNNNNNNNNNTNNNNNNNNNNHAHVSNSIYRDSSNMRLDGHNVDIKGSGDFVQPNDAGDDGVGGYENGATNNIADTKAARMRTILQKTKRKMRIRSDLDNAAIPDYKSAGLNWQGIRFAAGSGGGSNDNDEPLVMSRRQQQKTTLNNNTENKQQQQQPIKLPSTPPKHKAITVLKKPSPPSPRNRRVLIYNNQSPRLSHTRIQRSSRSRGGGNEVAQPNHQIVSGKVAEGRVRVLKSMSPVKKLDPNNHISDDDYDNDDDDLDNVSNFGDSDASNVTSESEEGYRSYAYKLTHTISHSASEQSILNTLQYSEASLTNPNNLLTPSLFPNVPPYLSFSSNVNKGPEIPADLYRVLKWRVSAVMPRVVRCILANSGMRLLKKTNDWMGVWGKHMKSPCFKSIRPYQKINHLPGSFRIGRKDSCWKNLVKLMAKHGKKDFGFMPKTYIIPNDLNQLRKNWPRYAQKNVKWIIKPPASARGTGIRVVDRWAQIPKRKPLIVQKYIERPLLINGSKFDLRLYVLVTSINPLRVYMYHNGLARFASVKYSDKSESLNDRCMHLTNYSINKLSSNYSKNEDVNACHGHKWTIKSLWNYLSSRGVRVECLWEALRNLVLRTILAGETAINNMIKANLESRYSCFELFGFDVLLDADLVPWLLEVNISPSLHSELPLDSHVKAPLVQSVLNTALFNVPPKIPIERQREIAAEMSLPNGSICYDKRLYINYLSRIEKIKHNTFTRKPMEDRDEYIDTILERLTPDDLRCLIIAEDELARSTPLERIFPTADTYKYLKYTETPRYYNRLLDAWETRYASNRNEGIELLRQYCEDKYHLQVPPIPAKKDSSDEEDEGATNKYSSDYSV